MQIESRDRVGAAPTVAHKAGWTLKEFAAAIGVGVSTIYAWPDNKKPFMVRLCGRVIVTESPRDYLSRMMATEQKASAA